MSFQPPMQYTLAELARIIHTDDLPISLQGDSHCVIRGVATIQQGKPGHIAFLTNPLYKKYLSSTQNSAVILSAKDASDCSINALISPNPHYTYAKVAALFDDKPDYLPGVHPTAIIGHDCQIDKSVSIGAHCTIGNHVTLAAGATIAPGCVIGDHVELGEHTILEARVTVYHRVVVGKRVIIASGTVVGSDGFSLAKQAGVWHKVPQLGRVIIENDVEIGANCTIDRGAIEDTIIRCGAKLDNLIQVGHNVQIGENTAIAGCVGIAGSTIIGKNCLIGGGSGFAGHITIADNVVITGKTAVTKSIQQPGVYSSGVGGLMTNMEWRKSSARLHRLDQLTQRVKALESVIKELAGEN